MEPRNPITNVDHSSVRRKMNTLDSVDRISDLPDSILGVILSLLPIKNAVATSTLSKRWEFLWRTVHNLHFSLDVQDDLTEEQVEAENKKFVGFVNHVILHHDAGVLSKFCLEWTPHCSNKSHATSWIKTAIARNVHEISLTCTGPFDMPISVFSCDSLRSLKLNSRWICLSATTLFCLPRLESLDLDGVAFESEETFEKMIRACPVLIDLRIKLQEDDKNFRFIISSTSLRHLELNSAFRKHLKLEASSLEHLKICGYIFVNIAQKTTSLVEADFWLSFDYMDPDENSYQDNCNSLIDALSALDTKILSLSEYVMQAIGCATIKLSTNFERLVKLETDANCCHWSSLQDFIQSSNNLEVLTISKYQTYHYGLSNHVHANWTTPIEVPRCLSNSLKKVVLDGYYGYEDEREMIRYMLKHGSVLEVMEISCDRDKRREIELVQEIHEFPRKSSACEVKLSRSTRNSNVKGLSQPCHDQ